MGVKIGYKTNGICKKDIHCTVFAHFFFSILAAEKSGCVKYVDFFVEVLIWVLF